MVDDNEIKTEVSPFAVREGEIKTFDGKDRICFYEPNYTQNKYRTYYGYSF